jgi:LysR family transcriptional regulator, benzoate and cis,cis-muconate-responsive activator of ben and cat genes
MRASFLVLLEEGRFATAALRLNLSPSALTKRMQRLERQVGVRLLVRDAAGLTGLTPAGARFATEAVPLLEAARAARRAALDAVPALTVRLGVPGRVWSNPRRPTARAWSACCSREGPWWSVPRRGRRRRRRRGRAPGCTTSG